MQHVSKKLLHNEAFISEEYCQYSRETVGYDGSSVATKAQSLSKTASVKRDIPIRKVIGNGSKKAQEELALRGAIRLCPSETLFPAIMIHLRRGRSRRDSVTTHSRFHGLYRLTRYKKISVHSYPLFSYSALKKPKVEKENTLCS
jgi:hypothetical protein